ncbi:MAG: MEDS domain-containing protein [Phycisphaerales bacterium]|nr:MEDS domain-containing protein [Phycisphaerales bacterium]MCI0629057.1 MEDS domain-containing protein [Phycisphaerales bacterium]MCI0675645.1 MEDS domain-containing protein [Phycisphaerales bacterium]
MSNRTPDGLLENPDHECHAAHLYLYLEPESLVRAIAMFVGGALDRGEAAIVVATEQNTKAVIERLQRSGKDCDRLRESGQLTCYDAEVLLSQIMDGRMPNHAVFHLLATNAIKRAQSDFGQVCIYGEMVNLLWQQDNAEAARELEDWWNVLIMQFRFPLLCGYRANVLEDRSKMARELCKTHSHVLAAERGRLQLVS